MSKRDYFSSYQSPNILIEPKEVHEEHENKKFISGDTTRSSSNLNNNKPPIISTTCHLQSIKKNKLSSSVTKIYNNGSLSGESKNSKNRTNTMFSSPMKLYNERGKTNESRISKPVMKSVVQVPVPITNIKNSKENNKKPMPTCPLATLDKKQVPKYENVDDLKSSDVIYKEIELIIDVVYKSETNDNEEDNEIPNEDLSFLDDFNIDEIVESLNCVDKISLKKEDTEENQEKDSTEKDNIEKYTKKDETSHRKDNVTLNVNLQVNDVSQINNNSTEIINISKSKASEGKTDLGIDKKKNDSNTKECDKEFFQKYVLNNDKKCLDIKYYNERIERNTSSIKEELMSDKDEKSIPPPGLYLTNREMYLSRQLQNRMSKSLNCKCTLQSILYRGSMSRLMKYRAENDYGVDYFTVIVMNPRYTMREERLKVFQHIERKTTHLAHIHDSCILLDSWCFITDFFPNTLKSLLLKENIHIKNLQILTRQLITAMFVLRKEGCVHTDCTTSNILVSSTHDRLKIFGFDKIDYFKYVQLTSDSGSVNYRPPEVIIGYPNKHEINVWSSALIMYEMATNTQLFPGTNNNEVLYQQLSLLGNLPDDMLYKGDFAHDHFCKKAFIRRLGPGDMDVGYIFHFKSEITKINFQIFETYDTIWSPHRTHNEILIDKSKLWQLVALIKRMLVLSPSKRWTLDSVYADSFIRELLLSRPADVALPDDCVYAGRGGAEAHSTTFGYAQLWLLLSMFGFKFVK